MHLSTLLTVALATLPLSLPRAPAPPLGGPLMCQELDIGEARSLPRPGGKDYDAQRLVADVAELQKTETDLIVRMETLRRAVLHAEGDRALAWELLGRAGLAVAEQAASGGQESIAWLDLGYLAACLRYTGADLDFRPGVAEGQEGYAYLLRALERARAENLDQAAVIEFAAALVVHPLARKSPTAQDVERYEQHVARARAGAAPGSLLARSLAAHEQRFDGAKDTWLSKARER
jgi:hypothetical protein